MRRHCGRMRIDKALPLTLLLAPLLSSITTAQTAQPTIKLQILSGLPVVDGVFLNGHGPYRFLLDTGEQANEMEPDLARKLGIASAFQRELDTPAGESQVQGASVNEVELGPMRAIDQEFLITEREGLRHLSSDIRGTLGQQFLAHFDYTLDLKNRRLDLGEPPAGTRVDFHLAFGCMVLPTDQGELMLDSGTDTLFFFRISPRKATVSIATSNANSAVALDSAPPLHIGGREYHPANAAFHPLADAPAAGLLPASLFRSIFVSNSEHFVVLDPAETKTRH
jgi:Aspartyl protease